MAATKVEELNRQLELLKNGKMDSFHEKQSSVAELDRLYKELQVCRSGNCSDGRVGTVLTVLSRYPFILCSVEEQTQPGPELKIAAAEGEPEQAQPGGGLHGQTDQRAARSAVEEKSGPAAEGEPACKSE